jgi:hypothetical protein
MGGKQPESLVDSASQGFSCSWIVIHPSALQNKIFSTLPLLFIARYNPIMNLKNLRIYDASGWTMFIFGILALIMGFVGLIRPEFILTAMGFQVLERANRLPGDFSLLFLIASSMASFNMGVYYVLAALNNVKVFYRWTVPFRVVTFLVFSATVLTKLAPLAWMGVATWELSGAIATGLALKFENSKTAKE